jgi:hypothetical protein
MRAHFAIVPSLFLVLSACQGPGDHAAGPDSATAETFPVGHLPFPTGDDYIHDKWVQLGGVHGPLGDYARLHLCWRLQCQPGAPMASVPVGPGSVGLMQQFENGQIYWSPNTGAHPVYGGILTKYQALGAANAVGFPVSDQISDGVGLYNDFETVTILDSSATGAHAVQGPIRDKYRALGAGRSIIGYPSTDQTEALDGTGQFNHFQYGSIFWSQGTGAFEIHGPIRDRWFGLVNVNSYLGYPTSDVSWVSIPFLGTVRATRFQRGEIVWKDDGTVAEVPDSISFHQQVLTPSGTALGGWVEVALQSNGDWSFKGHMHDSGFDSYSFRVVAVVDSGAGVPVAAQQSGSVVGTLGSGSRDFDWTQTGNNPLMSSSWDQVRSGTLTVTKSYADTGLLGTAEDIAKRFIDSLVADAVLTPSVSAVVTIGSELGKISGVHWAPPGGLAGTLVYGATVIIAGPGALVLGLMAGNAIHSRSMTSDEIAFVDQVFKGTVPYDRIVLTDLVDPFRGHPFTAPAVDGSILVNLGDVYGNPKNSTSNGHGGNALQPGETLIHELTHAWQITHGNFTTGFVCDGLWTQIKNAFDHHEYDYGPAGPAWTDFNPEQQAMIVQQWFSGSRVTQQKPMDWNDPYFWYISHHIWTGD